MKRILFKIVLTITLLSVINGVSLSKVTLAQINEGYLIIFENNEVPMDAIELLETKYSTLPKTIISEVGIIKLEKTGDAEQEQAIEELIEVFSNDIYVSGKEIQLNVPDKLHLTKNPNDFIISSHYQYLLEKNNSSKKHSTSVNLLNDQSDPVFEILGWDIPKVTENGASYLKQRGNHSIKVGLIDSGIDFNHPDLKDNIISNGESFVPGVDSTVDNMGHGTMTAGAIAANGRMMGVGPDLGIIPYKVMDSWEHGGESTWVIEAIIQAANDNVNVINLSVGTYKSLINEDDRAVVEGYSRAIEYAYKKGAILVASAGNDGYDTSQSNRLAEQMGLIGDKQVHLPGNNSKFLFNISATNKSDELSSYSNFGEISLGAPGGDYGDEFESTGLLNPLELVLTTYPTNLPVPYISQVLGLPDGYTLSAGTSLATPKVSGAIGVLIAEKKEIGGGNLSKKDIEKIFRKSSIDLGDKGKECKKDKKCKKDKECKKDEKCKKDKECKDPKFGHGLLNLNKALDFIK